jgi:uncharacterized protein (TIGR02001 family)
MTDSRKLAAVCGAVGLALCAMTGIARADGYGYAAPAPAEERKFTWSFNIDGTSDYVFRGISQTDNDPTIQGGLDMSYGILYVGWWASGLDFEAALNDAQVEMDWYGGIRPKWHDVTFDFGLIYYSYPGAQYLPPAAPAQLNYLEWKAGASGEICKNFLVGLTIYYSGDYFSETGNVWTFESSAAYTLPKVWVFTPVVNGVLAYQEGNNNAYQTFNGFDNYWYFNAGLALTVEGLTFDFRYWGTADAKNAVSDTLSCINHYCDSRFVFTAKVVLP